MKKYTVEQGIVAPLDRANVDTDLIIPKQFLKSIKRTGFGENLFDELRCFTKWSSHNLSYNVFACWFSPAMSIDSTGLGNSFIKIDYSDDFT